MQDHLKIKPSRWAEQLNNPGIRDKLFTDVVGKSVLSFWYYIFESGFRTSEGRYSFGTQLPPSISEYRQEMDENISTALSTAAFMVTVSSAWLHLSFPPFPAWILQSKAVDET